MAAAGEVDIAVDAAVVVVDRISGLVHHLPESRQRGSNLVGLAAACAEVVVVRIAEDKRLLGDVVMVQRGSRKPKYLVLVGGHRLIVDLVDKQNPLVDRVYCLKVSGRGHQASQMHLDMRAELVRQH